MALEFGTPPEPTRGKGAPIKYVEEAATLKSRPGEWAKLDTSHLRPASRKQMAAEVNRGTFRSFGFDFEAVTRSGETWLRYNPPIDN